MLPEGSPLVDGLLALIGVVACLAVVHLALWLGRRGDRLAFWVSGWGLITLTFIASHFLQSTAAGPPQAILAGRLAWTSAFALVPVMIGLAHTLAGNPAPSPTSPRASRPRWPSSRCSSASWATRWRCSGAAASPGSGCSRRAATGWRSGRPPAR